MNTFERSLSSAQEAVIGFDTRDDSSLAYVSCLFALEAVMPFSNAAEMEFSVTVAEGNSVAIDPQGFDLEDDTLEMVNLIASHYFQSKRCNLPMLVH
jgi:hypothetical protein